MTSLEDKMAKLGRGRKKFLEEEAKPELKKMVETLRGKKEESDSEKDGEGGKGGGKYLLDQPRSSRKKSPKGERESEHAPKPKPSSDRHDENGVLLNEPAAPPHSASDMIRFFKKPDYLHHPFAPPSIMTFVGPLGSGKSTAIYGVISELLEILDEKELGDVVYYSGSAGDRMLKNYGDKVHKYTPESEESFLSHVRSILSKSSDTPHDKKKRHIIVLDDAVSRDWFPKSTKTPSPITQLMISTRHIPATILMASQKMADLPTFARSNAMHMFNWASKSATEKQSLLNEAGFSKKIVENALDTLKQGEFVWIDRGRNTINRGMTQNLVH